MFVTPLCHKTVTSSQIKKKSGCFKKSAHLKNMQLLKCQTILPPPRITGKLEKKPLFLMISLEAPPFYFQQLSWLLKWFNSRWHTDLQNQVTGPQWSWHEHNSSGCFPSAGVCICKGQLLASRMRQHASTDLMLWRGRKIVQSGVPFTGTFQLKLHQIGVHPPINITN